MRARPSVARPDHDLDQIIPALHGLQSYSARTVKDVRAVHARLPDQVAATAARPGVNATSPSLIMMLVC